MPDPYSDQIERRETLIGNICIQWAGLEYMLVAGIWVMVDVEIEVGKILTANLDAKQRATMAHAIAWQVNAPHAYKKAIKEVLRDMREHLIHRRNEAVHGIHFSRDGEPVTKIEMHRGKGGRAVRELTNESLEELGVAINSAANKMANANRVLLQKLASERGNLDQVEDFARDILRNSSATSEEGETKGPV